MSFFIPPTPTNLFSPPWRSDVDSGSSSDSDPEPEQQKGRTKPAAFVFSDDEEDTKRVVRTQKDKRFDEMQTIMKQMKNHKKIRDMAKGVCACALRKDDVEDASACTSSRQSHYEK